MALEEQRQEALESLIRIQKFDANGLGRESDLGQAFKFTEAIEPAKNSFPFSNNSLQECLKSFHYLTSKE